MTPRTMTLTLPCGCEAEVAFTTDKAGDARDRTMVEVVDDLAFRACPNGCGTFTERELDALTETINTKLAEEASDA